MIRTTLTKKLFVLSCVLAAVLALAQPALSARMPATDKYTNFIGMNFVRIKPGTFEMGFEGNPLPVELTESRGTNPQGDFDEHPKHTVRISQPFYMGVCDVTNFQYELFDPEHRKLRGAAEDDEAVVNVDWYDAQAFCAWLSDKEHLPCRLPTEAEWEYACRAGTTTPYHTGNTLPQQFLEKNDGVLKVGQTTPNAWGLYDMHGNVEQWCYDWYGPYLPDKQTDPVGRVAGNFRVTRGGSHSTEPYYLRSANRLGTTPEDKHSLIGFRVVIGQMPESRLLPKPAPQPYQIDVTQNSTPDIDRGGNSEKPYFYGVRKFIIMPPGNRGPLYAKHNHFVSVAECPNGDLLAIWHTCIGESGRELAVAASRLRCGNDLWEPASLFWDAPDRNDHGHALWFDGENTIYHFNGLAPQIRNVAMVMRTSKDNGASWSTPHIIADHGQSRMPVESVFQTKQGSYVISCDKGPNVVWISTDKGLSWYKSAGTIRGKHACVAQLNDGRLLAFGRERNIDGKTPMSISDDMGKSWQHYPSQFQPISWGQRAVLLRLSEGPLFFASFCKRIMVADASGGKHSISGLFGAVSTDEGKTWPCRRLITTDGPAKDIETMDGHLITMDAYQSEASGYLAVCQSADGLIHLLSSRQHYAFNLKWLQTPPPAAPPTPPEPQSQRLPGRTKLPNSYKPTQMSGDCKWVSNPQGRSPEKLLKITIKDGRGFYLRSDDSEPFIAVDHQKGFTAEIRAQVLKRSANRRGVDIELYDGAAARYAVSITDAGVYWYEGFVVGSALLDFEQFTPVAEGLDNTDDMHTYRVAVRADRVVQIYRDGKLIGTRRCEYRTPRDAYIQFGGGGGLEALVDYVSYDTTGAYRPR